MISDGGFLQQQRQRTVTKRNGYKTYCILHVDNNEYMLWLKNKELIRYAIINNEIINNLLPRLT
jgi:hypothetical protein